MKLRKLNKKGFSLVELLAVLAIMGVIALIAIPAIGNVQVTARKNAFVSSGKTLISTMRNIVAEHGLSPTGSIPVCATVADLSEETLKSPMDNTKALGGIVVATYDSSTKKTTYTAYLTDGTNYATINSSTDKGAVNEKLADASYGDGFKTACNSTDVKVDLSGEKTS